MYGYLRHASVVPGCMRGTPAKSTRGKAVAQYPAEAATERLFTVQEKDESMDGTRKSH